MSDRALTRRRLLGAGAGAATDDPAKVPYEKTINPSVDVLRVDRLVGPTCTTTVRRVTRRATTTGRRARTTARTLTKARRAARAATGARVRLAGRSVRTNAKGRATLTLRRSTTATVRVTATATGYATRRTTLPGRRR